VEILRIGAAARARLALGELAGVRPDHRLELVVLARVGLETGERVEGVYPVGVHDLMVEVPSVRARGAIYVLAGVAFGLAVLLAALRVGEVPGALSGWQALVLGLVQGATELLPISSSGHLILVPWAADWTYLQSDDEFNQTFDVALHLGTLVAVVGYFWRDVLRLIASWARSVARRSITGSDERLAWAVFVATIPAAIAGALGEEFITTNLGEPWQIAILLAVFALVLLWADRRPATRAIDTVGVKEGLAIGLAQCLSLAPGVSRSGITISAARFLGIDRDGAARLSFLLLIPTTFGAILWKGVNDVLLGDLPPGWEGPFVVGMLAAFASGLLAIVFLLGFVRRHTYAPFVVYRLIVAALVLGLIATGVREAGF
jgi:undecaprenyl-diphosphatase